MNIFDSSTHPTLDGTWTKGRRGITFDELYVERNSTNVSRILAIGLPGVGQYDHLNFKSKCDEYDFEAIAALTTTETTKISAEVERIAKLGYRGIKVHPRLLKENRNLDYLSEVFSSCVSHEIVCLLCTYSADSAGMLPERDPYYQICESLNRNPTTRLILMHGGVQRVRHFSDLVRQSSSILLDLSFTMMTNETSTTFSDIQSVLIELDQRICFGSDSPEFGLSQFRSRLDVLLRDLPIDKQQNLSYRNLLRFFPNS